MIESIKHIFGLCGEPHPNLLSGLFVLIPGLSYIRYKLITIKRKFK